MTSAVPLLRVTIVIVSWNTRNLLAACLGGLADTIDRGFAEVIVVDNASTDGSVEMCRNRFPRVTVIRNELNVGFGAANNIGVAAGAAPLCLLLNSDTVVPPGAIEGMVELMETQPALGVLGCRLLNVDGTVQRSWLWFPFLAGLVSHESMLARLSPRLPQLFLEPPERRSAGECDWVYGAAMLVRREAFDAVGGFDLRLWMYGEEMELCYRIKAAGWTVGYDPTHAITHLGEGSWGKDALTPMCLRYQGLLWFYQHHRPWPQAHLAAAMISAGLALRGAGWFGCAALRPRGSAERAAGIAKARLHLAVLRRLCSRARRALVGHLPRSMP
jgi:GT2 family glycosyltransferase